MYTLKVDGYTLGQWGTIAEVEVIFNVLPLMLNKMTAGDGYFAGIYAADNSLVKWDTIHAPKSNDDDAEDLILEFN